MRTEKLWEADSFLRLPNDITKWILRESKTTSEIKVVLYISRLSHGFKRRRTTGRLCLGDFSSELKCNVSTASRAISKLLKAKRIFRFDPQGVYHYYSLYPDAMEHDAVTKPFTVGARAHGMDATSAKRSFASTQGFRGGPESMASIPKRKGFTE